MLSIVFHTSSICGKKALLLFNVGLFNNAKYLIRSLIILGTCGLYFKYGGLLLSLSICKMMRTIYVRKINKVLQWIRRSKQSCALKRYGRLIVSFFFFWINVGVRANLRAPRLITRALKLTTI
jgi:hypothetical protein